MPWHPPIVACLAFPPFIEAYSEDNLIAILKRSCGALKVTRGAPMNTHPKGRKRMHCSATSEARLQRPRPEQARFIEI